MTGRELIIYILSNGLEDEPVFKDGKFVGLLTVREAAVKFNVGVETVKAWYVMGKIKGVTFGSDLYILGNCNREA